MVDKYEWVTEGLNFDSVTQLAGGLKTLGHEIRPLLLREGTPCAGTSVEDVRHFLAFRVMDAVGTIAGGRAASKAYRVAIEGRPSQSKCVSFAVCWTVATLVLQFNDDRHFHSEQREQLR